VREERGTGISGRQNMRSRRVEIGKREKECIYIRNNRKEEEVKRRRDKLHARGFFYFGMGGFKFQY